MSFQPIQRVEGQDAWDNDHLQFARLIKEMNSNGLIHQAMVAKLAEKMDCTEDAIDDIIGRATDAFDDSMARYFGDDSKNEPEEETAPIPTTLEEVFASFAKGNSPIVVNQIREMSENEFIARAHPGMGRGIRNAWHLWWSPQMAEDNPDGYPQQEPELVRWLRETYGLMHGDDRSGILLTSWHRHLNGKPLDLEGQAAAYHQYWKDQKTNG